jgi:uncharacterized SAM-binding protein YcdF (DUF218 family)
MWIAMSKILPYLVYPFTLFLILGVVGIVLRSLGARRSGALAMVLSVLVLLAGANPWLASRLRANLEHWYTPVRAADAPVADAIVLLGGALALPVPPRVDAELVDASDRILYASRLFRAGKAPRIVVAGGNVFDQGGDIDPESHYISELLEEWGVPREAIIVEGSSRNTRQNAIETERILKREGLRTVLLVTSASHMPRALATFRALKIDAIPLPVDYSVSDYRHPLALDLVPSAGALAFNANTIREYLGILVYGVRGWLASDETAGG